MLSTLLMAVPIGAALVIWALPLQSRHALFAALLAAVVELGLWIGAVASFDFSDPGLQQSAKASWSADLGISYHVGLYDFSLWLVGLTAGVGLAAVAYALWAGRQRGRAYGGMLLFLIGSTAGVFLAQDLVLFYVFFEAMLIPLYLMIGGWGGDGARAATIKFVIYTIVGSLLMAVSIVSLGLTQGTFDMTLMGTSGSVPIFLGFLLAFGIKAPVWPLHGWLPDAYRESPPEVSALLSGVISKTAAFGLLRIAIPLFPEPTATLRDTVLVLATIGLVYGALVAFRQPDFRGVVAYSSLSQMCLIVIGLFAVNDSGLNGALLQMVNHGLISAALFLIAGCIESRTATGMFSGLGGMARGRPVLATVLIVVGVIALAVPGSGAFAAEFLVLNGVFAIGWGWAVFGAIAIVLAAMYMLRAISATLHGRRGPAVDDRQRDLRPAELAVVLPLVAVLLLLSFWPAAVTDHSFGGEPVAAVTSQFEGAP